ncbi:MAG: hypothetical protein JWO67_759 [Streptosporangiaceae bacterium]|nr:hypothetical protein [Streptosporangiaceae bacterium]
MSYRELWEFVKHLPPESWTQTKLRDSDMTELIADEPGEPEFGPWSLVNYQLAALTDAINAVAYKVHVAGDLRPDPEVPEPTPRPGLKPRVQQAVLSEAAVIYLNARRAPKG